MKIELTPTVWNLFKKRTKTIIKNYLFKKYSLHYLLYTNFNINNPQCWNLITNNVECFEKNGELKIYLKVCETI